ncbi:cytochrome p450 [Trichoderma cornu-damae]|uniref:Cytochrome p450 n=1 Tax=Trichoderma cornu-damae TaxID=654480 RepID=A0A9P8TWG6_9HYPO|nr:cytochrome p450 [Trichoderma cornu-damae]
MTIGPVVRINPHELHCNDPKFLDTLYPSGVKNREKAMTFTRDHQLHRKRRATLIKFFSRSRILKLQDDIQARVQKLCDKLLASRGQRELGAVKVYSTFATDIISDYLYGWSFNFLDKSGWDANYLASMEMLESMAFVNRHIPFVRNLQPYVPPVLTFYLLDKPQICAKVRTELETIVEDPTHLPPWEVLEKLPYLSGVILEGIRLSHGVSGRMPRIAPDEDMVYRGVWNSTDVTYVIPRGWAIGTSSPLIHTHESIFPQPLEFIPERWLDENNHRRRDLEAYIMSFGKGSRVCLGMQ